MRSSGWPIEQMRWSPLPAKLNHISKTALAIVKFGGPGETRTRATRFRRPVLCPLSYGPITLSSCRHWQLECTIVQFHSMSRLLLDITILVRTKDLK